MLMCDPTETLYSEHLVSAKQLQMFAKDRSEKKKGKLQLNHSD